MRITVSRSLGIPLVTQIRDQIVAAIAMGDLAVGDRLPTIRQLAQFLDINRNTVAQVYRLLEQDGYVATRGGGGTRVADDAATADAVRARALRQRVQDVLRDAEEHGFSSREFAEAAYYEAAQREVPRPVRVLVVDEYAGEMEFLLSTIASTLPGSTVRGVLLHELEVAAAEGRTADVANADFALVPFYCLERAAALLSEADLPVLAAGVGPSLASLRRISEIGDDDRVAIVCTEPTGPESMERSLQRAGVSFSTVRHGYVGQDDLSAIIAECDVLVASQGSAQLVRALVGRKPVIMYSTLVSDESLATIRSFASYVDRDRGR